MEDCNYLELQSMARQYKERRMAVQQNKKIVSTTPIAICGYWSQHLSSSGRLYFYNRKTEVSQWHQPEDWHPVSPESFKEKTKIQETLNLELKINEVLNANDMNSMHNKINNELLKDKSSLHNFNGLNSKYENNLHSNLPLNNSNSQFDLDDYINFNHIDYTRTKKFSPSHSNLPNKILNDTQSLRTNSPKTYEHGTKNFVEFNTDFTLKQNINSQYSYDPKIESSKDSKIKSLKQRDASNSNKHHNFNISRSDEQRLERSFESIKDEKALISDNQQLREIENSSILPLNYNSTSDDYTKVFKLFKSITTSFKVFTTLEEGPQFEKESTFMLASLMQLSDLVLILNHSQYIAIFKMYLNLVEEAVQVIMEKLLPAECLEDHEDQLQSLLTRLIAVINENKYNDEDDDNVVAMDDDDDDGEIVSDEDEVSRINHDSYLNGFIDHKKGDFNNLDSDKVSVNNELIRQISVSSNKSDFTNKEEINLNEKYLDNGNNDILYSNNVEFSSLNNSNFNKKINSDLNCTLDKDTQIVNCRINHSPYNNQSYNLNSYKPEFYTLENNVLLKGDTIEKMEEDSLCDEDEGLCNTADDEEANDEDEKYKKAFNERLSDIPDITANVDLSESKSIIDSKPSPLSTVHDPFAILLEFQHLFDGRFTNHFNSWQSLEKQADQRFRESSHFMNIPYRVAITALKKARSNLRVEDTIFQLQLHRKQHLESQIKALEEKTL